MADHSARLVGRVLVDDLGGGVGDVKLTGGATFDPDEEFCYFAAGIGRDLLGKEFHGHKLVSVTRLTRQLDLAANERLLVDSAAFEFAQTYAAKHDVPLHVALTTPLDQMEGFDWLYETYIELITRFEDQLWGYVEIDLGGVQQKRETRARLEAEGLRPIPVYHIASDGWDYFDELASQYDRICIGNLVNMTPAIRKRAMVTIWERRRKHPSLRWIHLLGYSPSHHVNAYPANSADSTSWRNGLRFGGSAIGSHGMQQIYARFDDGFSPTIGVPEEWDKGLAWMSMQAHMLQLTWRSSYRDLAEALGLDTPYPAPLPGEPEPVQLRRSP